MRCFSGSPAPAAIMKHCVSSASIWRRSSPPRQNLKNLFKRKAGMPMNDKWEILHGDALKLLGGFAPGAFDASSPTRLTPLEAVPRQRRTSPRPRSIPAWGITRPRPSTGTPRTSVLDPLGGGVAWRCQKDLQTRRAGVYVHRLAAAPSGHRRLQWAGWIWRGTAVWDKGNSRPQKGRFRQQAEYIVWGSNGDMPISDPCPACPACSSTAIPRTAFT